ncbi:hypothetical protein RV04_GL001221 [Enterococcus hermanniensis]|uniref:ABC3 transporter permease protein domain-containing protein n=2 Tax=Enterococcus hermanniensis TaxID=249189 RepID=A0A1L8TAI4_9ENTE|nr:hypothetical protein RV04_GL001221 [Enterococcus hermanniensis]
MAVLLFVGIKSVGPNLETSIQNYVEKQNTSDLQIVGTAGLTKDDQALAKKIAGAEVELGYSFPYADEKNDKNIQMYSYNKADKQNELKLLAGKLPKNKNEIVLDKALKSAYPIGSTIKIDDSQLAESSFKVVGYVESPIYVDKTQKGSTIVGDGSLDGYAYLPATAFDSDAYSIMYLKFADLASKDMFSDSYEEALVKKENQLEKLFDRRKSERKQELVDTANAEIQKNQSEIDDNRMKLDDGQKQINAARQQIDQQKNQLAEQKERIEASGNEEAIRSFTEAQTQVTTAESKLNEQEAELKENSKKINDGQTEIDKARNDLAEMKLPNYLLTERRSNPGFEEVTSLSTRIDAIGNIFPVFFFLIGILITFTTITRMVEEDRKVIGTLKALGYRNSEIAQKYIVYAALTAIIGTVLGVLVGTKLLPPVVFKMMGTSYVFQSYPTNFWLVPIVIAIAGALLATLGATIYILIKDLREKPVALLMPKAPKPGKRIFLEYITPLWSRLSFNQKVTYRNLFRYKARMILTVAGIAGCCGLMLAGFGLKDSIGDSADIQFNQLTHYQAIVTLESDQTTQQADKAVKVIDDNNQINQSLPVYSSQVNFKKEGITDQSATVYGFQNNDHIDDHFTFKKKTKDSSTDFNKDGIVITQGLAKAYDVTVGDKMTMQDGNGKNMHAKVIGIVENYLGNSIYTSQRYLEKISKESTDSNTFLLKTKSMNNNAEKKLSKQLQDTGQVITTTFMSDQLDKQAYASTNLDPVVIIFVVLSGTLALVVLFNLTNINVSERERELATIKVLGFYDPEVTMYIIREMIIFTIMGILIGFGVGNALTWFIITTASSPMISFPLVVPMVGYIFSAGLTILFTGIVMFITHQRLKAIDMIGALKSNE